MKNSQWFFRVAVHDIIEYNDSHLVFRCKIEPPEYLLSTLSIYPGIEPVPAVYDKNISFVYIGSVDFLLFTLSGIPERRISTTIITLLQRGFTAFTRVVGLRYLNCGNLPTGSVPMVFRVGLVMPIFGAQGEIENEYVFVSFFMIEFFCFTFGSASIRESEYCVVRQSSDSHPEDNSCDGH